MACLLQRHGCRVEADDNNLYFYDLRSSRKWAVRKSELPDTKIAAIRYIRSGLITNRFNCTRVNADQTWVQDLVNYLFA